jgi:hypothetical protein
MPLYFYTSLITLVVLLFPPAVPVRFTRGFSCTLQRLEVLTVGIRGRSRPGSPWPGEVIRTQRLCIPAALKAIAFKNLASHRWPKHCDERSSLVMFSVALERGKGGVFSWKRLPLLSCELPLCSGSLARRL